MDPGPIVRSASHPLVLFSRLCAITIHLRELILDLAPPLRSTAARRTACGRSVRRGDRVLRARHVGVFARVGRPIVRRSDKVG